MGVRPAAGVAELPYPILLYDGVCGLCNQFVQFVLHRDPRFRFASLQSSFAARILERHNTGHVDLETVYVLLNYQRPNECLLARSEAVVCVLKQLGGIWRLWAFLLQSVPKFLRNYAYNAVARSRYKFFGRSEVCELHKDADRIRFLDEE